MRLPVGKIGVLSLSLFLWLSGTAGSDIFRFIDKEGVVHFTNAPPKGSKAVRLPSSKEEEAKEYFPGYVSPKTKSKAEKSKSRQKVKKNKPTPTQKKIEKVFGTAFPISTGQIVTAYHVIKGHEKITLKFTNGESIPAIPIVADEKLDIAILEIEDKDLNKLPPAIPLSATGMKLGAKVFAIGFPHQQMMGSVPKLTDGIVSSEMGYRDDPHSCQITVPVQSGNSGSPLIDMNGALVGIVASKLDAFRMLIKTGDLPQNVNYAIKVQFLKALLESTPQRKKPGRIEELPIGAGSLEVLAGRVQGSVLKLEAN